MYKIANEYSTNRNNIETDNVYLSHKIFLFYVTVLYSALILSLVFGNGHCFIWTSQSFKCW